MFSVGRYDPNLDKVKQSSTIRTGSHGNNKRKISSSSLLSATGAIQVGKEQDLSTKEDENFGIDIDAKLNVQIESDNDDNDQNEDSSSCPSSSSNDDSSSCASSVVSTEDEDETRTGDIPKPALQVIAPKQKENSIDVMRKRLKTTNEGMDDFDHDNDNSSIKMLGHKS